MNEKNINDEKFWYYFNYRNPLFSIKNLLKANQAKNEQLVNQANDALIDIKENVIRKEIP